LFVFLINSCASHLIQYVQLGKKYAPQKKPLAIKVILDINDKSKIEKIGHLVLRHLRPGERLPWAVKTAKRVAFLSGGNCVFLHEKEQVFINTGEYVKYTFIIGRLLEDDNKKSD